MSLSELSSVINNLLEVVNSKNREIEDLKSSYNAKLKAVNRYLEILSDSGLNPSSSLDNKELKSDEFIRQIDNDIHCHACNAKIWDLNDKESEYIIFPKSRLHIATGIVSDDKLKSIVGGVSQLELNVKETHDPRNVSVPGINISSTEAHKKRWDSNKSKRKCSYCGKLGHNRSKCLVRLATPTTKD